MTAKASGVTNTKNAIIHVTMDLRTHEMPNANAKIGAKTTLNTNRVSVQQISDRIACFKIMKRPNNTTERYTHMNFGVRYFVSIIPQSTEDSTA